MEYDHLKIESKWQNIWLKEKTFKANIDRNKKKVYVLDMFPYPSGAGLHVGHPLGYTATDIYSRFKRLQGFSVLHPMGWDAFGLPAEQYAIKTGTHPKDTTEDNIKNFKRQIQMLGFSYDWDREINTTDEKYYKWTQWIFLQLYKKGLAYEAKVPVNWCPELKAVLANEEVVDGKSEIGGHPVVVVHAGFFPKFFVDYAEDGLSRIRDDWHKGGGKYMSRARRFLRVRYVNPEGNMVALGQEKEGDYFWAESYDGAQGYVFYGHQPYLKPSIPRSWEHACGIDTGCCFGGRLTAAVVIDDPHHAKFVSVDALDVYAAPREDWIV